MSVRELDAADLAGSFATAQAALTAAPAGSTQTWIVPPGTHELTAGVHAGDGGRSLTLRGTGATLVFGAAAPLLGDVTGLELTGADVHVDGLAITVRAAGEACGLRIRAGRSCTVYGVHVDRVEGATATGLDLRCADELGVLDVDVARVNATGDACGALLVSSGDVAVRGLSIEQITGARATGAAIVVGRELDWSGGRLTSLRGTSGGCAGVRVLATPEQAVLRLTDLAITQLSAAQPGLAAPPADSWRSWLEDAARPLAEGSDLPAFPAPGDPDHIEDAVAVHLCAPVDEGLPWLRRGDPGAVQISGCVIERISGVALQVVADLRDVELRGLLIWTVARAGHVEAERVLLATSTIHRVGWGLGVGPCALTVADILITTVANGSGLPLDDETDLGPVVAGLIVGALPPFEPAPDPLPYVGAGPLDVPAALLAGDVVPDAPHDLRVPAEVHARARHVPGDDDDVPAWIGALAPDAAAVCELRDPAPPPPPPSEPALQPGPVVDYRARDARSLLTLMTDRARQVMPGWEPTGAADQTTMLLELLAERLDQLAYSQEVAVSEGTLPTALERRSVEDHVRLVDYQPDPGLSATTMVRFRLDPADAAALELGDALAVDGSLIVGGDTLVVNPDATDRIVVFGTESDLALSAELDSLQLADETDLEPGAITAIEAGDTEALLAGDLLTLTPGRWLVVVGVDPQDPERLDPDVPAHVVRVTQVEIGTDTTRVRWDPRRPAPVRYERASTRVLGNVVPAHHGIPLTPISTEDVRTVLDQDDLLTPWRERLTITVDGTGLREVPLPVDRVSVQAAGWPFPGEPARTAGPQIRLSVDGEPWPRVDDLAAVPAGEEAFALRTGPGDKPVVRFPDLALPARTVSVDLAVRIGLGTVGNVGVGALSRLLAIGPSRDRAALLGDGGADRVEQVRRALRVSNPVPGVGGREPEELESLRYRAPLGVRDALSAVVPADYERLVGELADVAAARAVVRDGPLAPAVSVTVLLRDEDRLATSDQGQAERLRRWAAARARLEDARLLGFDVALVPPRFVPLDLDLVVDVDRWALDRAEVDVARALDGPGGLFDPDVSGLGGDVHVDAITRCLLAVPGVRAVQIRRLRRLQPSAPERARVGVLTVEPDEVAILTHPYGQALAGLLTVGVCEASS